jgi:hypothetical protein
MWFSQLESTLQINVSLGKKSREFSIGRFFFYQKTSLMSSFWAIPREKGGRLAFQKKKNIEHLPTIWLDPTM